MVGILFLIKASARSSSEEEIASISFISDSIEEEYLNDDSFSSSKLKKTGQTISYDKDGNEVADGSIKNDGYYQAGVTPSYKRDIETEIITDNITKLMWQDNYEAKTVTKTWAEAKSYCENEVQLGGYSDWRLPSIVELQSIVVDGKSSPSIDTTVFANYTTFSNYWSSTTARNCIRFAWVINFSNGYTNYYFKLNKNNYVRCVRTVE